MVVTLSAGLPCHAAQPVTLGTESIHVRDGAGMALGSDRKEVRAESSAVSQTMTPTVGRAQPRLARHSARIRNHGREAQRTEGEGGDT